MRDYFSIIVNEICTKQNGIELKRGDDTVLRDMFISNGGNVDKLHNGVLPEFDKLKDIIVGAYQSRKIGSTLRVASHKRDLNIDPESFSEQVQIGSAIVEEVAERAIGKELLATLKRGS